MASLVDWLWTFCRVGMFLGILPVQKAENDAKKVTFRFWSFPFFWSLLIICASVTSIGWVVPLFYKYFDLNGYTLADRIGSYVMVVAGFGITLTYVSAQLLTARKVPGLLEDLYESWKELESVDSSTAASSSGRSFLFTLFCCGSFYLADVSMSCVIVQGFPHLAWIVSSALMLVIEAGLLALFLFICLSCQILKVILEERLWELRNATKSLRNGEVLALYLETHLRVSQLSRRLSSAFHPTLYLSFLTQILMTITFAFYIISWIMRSSWLMAGMALARTLFGDFLLFSLCRTADGLSSKAEEIILTLTSDRTLILDEKSRNQVMHFESLTRTHQVKLQASGYFTLNKALLTSEYLDRNGNTLADRITSYIMGFAGLGAVLTYISSQLVTARKVPGWLEDVDEAWNGSKSVVGSAAESSSRRSFLITVFCCSCFYLVDVASVWISTLGFIHPVGIACSVFTCVVETGLMTLYLFISLSCQILKVILEQRAWELQNTLKPSSKEVLSLYLETHLQVSYLSRRFSSVLHPALFLNFLTDIVMTIVFAFFIISWALEGSWLMASMASVKTLFFNFLLFSLCQTADSLSSKGEEIILTLTNDRTLSADKKSKIQVIHFESQTRTHQVKLEASGYFTLNKALLTSVASNMLTYLIVLLEFRRPVIQSSMSQLGSCDNMQFLDDSGTRLRFGVTSVGLVIQLFQKYFNQFGYTLGDRIGFYIMIMAGFGITLTYVSAQLQTARKIPEWLEDLHETWKELESVEGSTAASSSRRSFLFTVLCCGCFYLANAAMSWIVIHQQFSVPSTVVNTALMLVIEAGLLTLILFLSLSCQAVDGNLLACEDGNLLSEPEFDVLD
ncbi:unnamed protein product [Darwinula stevensoni]|uniref:Gustatory receptor n=1 Tax=Darwinula stevensoni TaxID=69355 RepID=A0A7R9A718_9CRUS|nr:unnamed protein product [Darwinula stevensoni]CAG0891109.1 unnamed protein product [Darwinula stevensoni]